MERHILEHYFYVFRLSVVRENYSESQCNFDAKQKDQEY